MKAMWLTLPGAAMLSIPVIYFVRKASGFAWLASFYVADSWLFGGECLLAIATAFTASFAGKYCLATSGHNGLRTALMVFNAAAYIAAFAVGVVAVVALLAY